MKNAIQRLGYTCAAAMIAAAFSTTISAQILNRITVNLPESVVVGSTTLPAGAYNITDLEPMSGHHVFVFRGASGKPLTVQADEVEEQTQASKTNLTLQKQGSEYHLDKLQVQGSPLSYEFGK